MAGEGHATPRSERRCVRRTPFGALLATMATPKRTTPGQPDPDAWTAELKDRIRNVHAAEPPTHVLHRLAAVLHRERLAFVDNDLHDNGHGRLGGRMVVFTERIAAIVDLEHVSSDFTELPDDIGSVIVRFVPRRSLTVLDVNCAGPDYWHNNTDIWSNHGGDSWPMGGRVALSYPSIPDTVIVPTDFREDFYGFLPSLLDDLAS